MRLLVVPGILSDSLRDSAKASTLLTVQLDCAAPPGADFDPYALPGKEEYINVTLKGMYHNNTRDNNDKPC